MAKILIIDDEDPLRELLAELLEEAGHDVTQSADGRISGDADLISTMDVVVTDIMMPESDGIEVIRAVKSSNPSARVIAMSGGGRTVSMDMLPVARQLGADTVLYKPFKPSDFLDSIETMLS